MTQSRSPRTDNCSRMRCGRIGLDVPQSGTRPSRWPRPSSSRRRSVFRWSFVPRSPRRHRRRHRLQRRRVPRARRARHRASAPVHRIAVEMGHQLKKSSFEVISAPGFCAVNRFDQSGGRRLAFAFQVHHLSADHAFDRAGCLCDLGDDRNRGRRLTRNPASI